MKKPYGNREEYVNYLYVTLRHLYVFAIIDYLSLSIMWVIFLYSAWLIWMLFGISFISLAFGALVVWMLLELFGPISGSRHVVYFRMDVWPRLLTLIKKDLQSQSNTGESMEKSSGDKKDFVGILCLKFRNFYLLCVLDIALLGVSIICTVCYGYFFYLKHSNKDIPVWLYASESWMPIALVVSSILTSFVHHVLIRYFKDEAYPQLLKLFRKDLASQPNDESPWKRE
ncbi:MAG: hypothetical protein ACD_11C00116G0047 [uncultured bacterium]|nr:MAG: hypothetical protein ACD_11C00116G0047 [uncultured bacterium]HBR71583.1 hypothetical protein [Candidatus Moranbacteria bacterium]